MYQGHQAVSFEAEVQSLASYMLWVMKELGRDSPHYHQCVKQYLALWASHRSQSNQEI